MLDRGIAFGSATVSDVDMAVVSIRRYPVKSMGGESLDSVAIDRRGLSGDRWYAVEDQQGHFASGKTTRRFRRRDAVFGFRAETAADSVLVTGPQGTWRVDDPALDVELTRVMGADVAVSAEREIPHQDMGSISLIMHRDPGMVRRPLEDQRRPSAAARQHRFQR